MRSKAKKDWATVEQYNFLEDYLESYSLTESHTPQRSEWRAKLYEEWTVRFGKMDANQKHMISTYLNNQTRPQGKWAKAQIRNSISKSSNHNVPSVGQAHSAKDGDVPSDTGLQEDMLDAKQVVQSGTHVEPEAPSRPSVIDTIISSTSETSLSQSQLSHERSPASVTTLEKTPVGPGLAERLSSPQRRSSARRIFPSEMPRLRRYEGEEDIVIDIELPGFTRDDVQIFYDDMRLHLFAKKDQHREPELVRTYAGSLRVGSQNTERISCGMANGLLRVILERKGPAIPTNTPEDKLLEIQDVFTWEFF